MIPYYKACPGSQGFAADILEGVWAALKAWLVSPDVWKLPFSAQIEGWGGGMVDDSWGTESLGAVSLHRFLCCLLGAKFKLFTAKEKQS